MFLTYCVLEEKLFVLTHTVENVFVMFYNLPYSCPLPLIVSREVRTVGERSIVDDKR